MMQVGRARAFVEQRWVEIAVLLWGSLVIAAFGALLHYKSTAGKSGVFPATWPAASALSRAKERATLVMFVHPHCSCSRASLTELGHTLTRVPGLVTTEVVFVLPSGVAPAWGQTDLRDAAQALPNVSVIDDVGGAEAKRFGANVSGTCVLYDKFGQLLFAGGITALRAHEGNSFGQERIVALLTTGSADRHDSPVFGCDLDETHGEGTE